MISLYLSVRSDISYKQMLFHENALDFYGYLWELKYKLQIERMICNGTSNCEQLSKFPLFTMFSNTFII